MRFFNDYVKSHDYLNHRDFLPRRFRFQRTLFTYRIRMNRKQFFRAMFYLQNMTHRHRVVEFQGINMDSIKHSVDSNYHVFPAFSLAQSPTLCFAAAARRLPVLQLVHSRYLFRFSLHQINL